MKTKIYAKGIIDTGMRFTALVLLLNSVFSFYSFGQLGAGTNLPTECSNQSSVAMPTLDNPYVLVFLLLSFEVEASQRQARIRWSTQYHLENYFFTIERTLDGIQWEPVHQMASAASADEQVYYAWTDENPHSEISYYRLKIDDDDGETQYSLVKAFYLNTIESAGLLAYPNPAVDNVILEGAADDIAELTILDAHGMDVSLNATFSSGYSNHLIIDVSAFPTGYYYLRTPENFVKLFKQ